MKDQLDPWLVSRTLHIHYIYIYISHKPISVYYEQGFNLTTFVSNGLQCSLLEPTISGVALCC